MNEAVNGEQRVWDETNAVVTLADGGFIVAYSGKGTETTTVSSRDGLRLTGLLLVKRSRSTPTNQANRACPPSLRMRPVISLLLGMGKAPMTRMNLLSTLPSRRGSAGDRATCQFHNAWGADFPQRWNRTGWKSGYVWEGKGPGDNNGVSIADFKRTVLRMVASKG